MFVLCEGMKWSHLPWAGGIYDQHPDLIEGFRLIFSERAKHDAEERDKQERKHDADMRRAKRGSGRVAGRRR